MSGSKGTCPPASMALGIGIILCRNVARGRDTVPTDIMGVRVQTCHSEPDAWQGGFIWATPHGGPGWIQSYICTNSRPPRTQCALPARASFQNRKHWFWTPALSWDAQYLRAFALEKTEDQEESSEYLLDFLSLHPITWTSSPSTWPPRLQEWSFTWNVAGGSWGPLDLSMRQNLS